MDGIIVKELSTNELYAKNENKKLINYMVALKEFMFILLNNYTILENNWNNWLLYLSMIM